MAGAGFDKLLEFLARFLKIARPTRDLPSSIGVHPVEDGSKRTSTALFSRRRFNAPSVVGKLDPLAFSDGSLSRVSVHG